MYSIQIGVRPVSIADITADICPVSAANICPVSTQDISISIHHSASAFSINNHHIMEAATAADFWLPWGLGYQAPVRTHGGDDPNWLWLWL